MSGFTKLFLVIYNLRLAQNVPPVSSLIDSFQNSLHRHWRKIDTISYCKRSFDQREKRREKTEKPRNRVGHFRRPNTLKMPFFLHSIFVREGYWINYEAMQVNISLSQGGKGKGLQRPHAHAYMTFLRWAWENENRFLTAICSKV